LQRVLKVIDDFFTSQVLPFRFYQGNWLEQGEELEPVRGFLIDILKTNMGAKLRGVMNGWHILLDILLHLEEEGLDGFELLGQGEITELAEDTVLRRSVEHARIKANR
jgi:hypothetical protein